MLYPELAGLMAAFCWTISSLMAPRLIARFGIMRFNTTRIVIASLLLLIICLLSNRFSAVLWEHATLIILSGLLGIFLGDTLLFNAVHRLGPRRAGVLFATNAPISILLGWLFLDEDLSLQQLIACALVSVGVGIAILFGKRQNNHAWEDTKGSLSLGVLLALGGALGQASGALLSKPALLDGADPIAVSAVRVGAGALALMCAYMLYYRHQESQIGLAFSQLSRYDFLGITALATIGMVMGMSALVWGVGHAHVGLVTTLSATSPVLILPALWITTRQRPALGAWIGASLVVSGAGLIILH